MEVCVDNMLIKSYASGSHIDDLEETFASLHQYQMKLNLLSVTSEWPLINSLGSLCCIEGLKQT